MLQALGLAVGCALVMDDLPPPPDGAAGAGGTGAQAGQGSPSAGAEDGAGTAGAGAAVVAAGGAGGSQPSSCVEECDCDGDGAAAAGVCGGDDCDDSDGNVWPGQPKFYYDEREAGGWDYDCSGAIERERPVVDCSGIPSCDTSLQGFMVGDPQCGTRQDWGECQAEPVICMPTKISSEPVNCH